MRPELHIVAPPAAPPTEIAPEKRLRGLFRTEARLERQLLDTRREIAAERKRYADKHRMGFLPAMETLRRLFR